MTELHNGATEVVRTNGKSRLFIDFAFNPAWSATKEALLPNHTAVARPDITARVSNIMIDAILKDLASDAVLGMVVARKFVVASQNRGLPHAHVLCILANGNAPRFTDDCDDSARTVIPDPEKEHALWRTITTSLMRGNMRATQAERRMYGWRGAREGVPEKTYRLGGRCQSISRIQKARGRLDRSQKSGKYATHRAGPYNPRRASICNARINGEGFSTVSAAMYLCKYVYK